MWALGLLIIIWPFHLIIRWMSANIGVGYRLCRMYPGKQFWEYGNKTVKESVTPEELAELEIVWVDWRTNLPPLIYLALVMAGAFFLAIHLGLITALLSWLL